MALSGDMAEGAVLGALVKAACSVLVPYGQGQPYDLAVDRGEAGFVRLQVKTGWLRRDCLLFNCCSTDHGRGRQDYRGRADVFGVFSPDLDRVFVMPVELAATRTTSLRLHPTINHQARRVNFAEDYALERWLPHLRPAPAVRAAA